MGGAHSVLAPSKSKQWRPCPGSLWLNKDVEEDEDIEGPAAEGTMAHALAAHCLGSGVRCVKGMTFTYTRDELIGPEEITPDDEMVQHVANYVQEVLEWSGHMETFFGVEQKIDLAGV